MLLTVPSIAIVSTQGYHQVCSQSKVRKPSWSFTEAELATFQFQAQQLKPQSNSTLKSLYKAS